MNRSTAASLMTLLAALGVQAQQSQQPIVVKNSSPSVVSVVHTSDLYKMLARMREQNNLRVGVAPSAPPHVYNIATGLIVDNAGHIVTRLANVDLQDKDQTISITTSNGATMPARLIGVDCATGFAVLEAAGLVGGSRAIVTHVPIRNGMAVNIVSSDVVRRSASSEGASSILLWPSLQLAQGNIWANTAYSKARGALTLLSNNLTSRNDSSVVQTLDNQVIGLAQWAGFGRAYLFPLEFIRDTIARRVIERKDNVPAGWLGAIGVSLAQLSETEIGALGLERTTGVIVREVVPESPAAAGGLRPNDVIVGVDELDVVGTPDLKAVLSWSPAGQKVTLRALRNGQLSKIDVVLGERPDSTLTIWNWGVDQSADPLLSQRDEVEKRLAELRSQYRKHLETPHSRNRDEALRELDIEMRLLMEMERALLASGTEVLQKQSGQASMYQPSHVAVDGPWSPKSSEEDVRFKIGFTARELSSQLAAKFNTVVGRILVSSVVKDSVADRAGIRTGDVIVSSEERVMMGIPQLQVLLSNQRGEISLKVIRDGQITLVNLNNQ
ncbi:MAG: PDZ domain-containing protein [Blastocatellia bacterium]